MTLVNYYCRPALTGLPIYRSVTPELDGETDLLVLNKNIRNPELFRKNLYRSINTVILSPLIGNEAKINSQIAFISKLEVG